MRGMAGAWLVERQGCMAKLSSLLWLRGAEASHKHEHEHDCGGRGVQRAAASFQHCGMCEFILRRWTS